MSVHYIMLKMMLLDPLFAVIPNYLFPFSDADFMA